MTGVDASHCGRRAWVPAHAAQLRPAAHAPSSCAPPRPVDTNVQRVLASRAFSVTPQRANLISDLYVSQIKAFKPTPFTAKDAEAATKSFELPSKPAVPETDISADSLSQYEAADVETEAVGSSGSVAAEEDWFVFEEAEEAH